MKLGGMYRQQIGGSPFACDWDENANYGNEYAKVYFRTITTGFNSAEGVFETEEAFRNYDTVIGAALCDLGYAFKHNDFCYNEEKMGYLFNHPNHISGVVKKNDIRLIAERLLSMPQDVVKLTAVDVYETIFDIPDDKLFDVNVSGINKERLECSIIQCAATKRRNLFRNRSDVERCIQKSFPKRVQSSRGCEDEAVTKAITSIIDELIEAHWLIVPGSNPNLIRSANKTEQKKYRLAIPGGDVNGKP